MANVFDNIQAQKHVVCESSLLKATIAGHMYNLKMIGDTDNGSIVARGDWDSSTPDGQVFNAKEYVEGDAPLLVLTPPIGYNSDRKYYTDEQYFYNAAGEIARAYEIYEGDIYTVSESAITKLGTEIVINNYVTVEDGLYAETDSKPASGFIGQIIDKVNYTNSVSYRILVVSTGV
jgi:hypothetical protein